MALQFMKFDNWERILIAYIRSKSMTVVSQLTVVSTGPFKGGNHHNIVGNDHLLLGVKGKLLREKVPMDQIEKVEPISTETKFGAAQGAGFAVAGLVLLGPAGILAGLLGKRQDTAFICTLKDGRKFAATAPTSAYNRIVGALVR
jgi:hypothetical protein